MPRIRFVQAFRGTEDLADSTWDRVSRTVMGGSRDPMIMNPMGVAVSDDGQRLYIADYGGGRVLVADFAAKSVTAFAPDEPMKRPFGVALDEKENVYVSDAASSLVRVYTRGGARLRELGAGELERPTGLALDRERRLLYVSDTSSRKSQQHRVRAFSLDDATVRDVGARAGEPTKGDGDGRFYFPTYLALDARGNLYVSDSMNFRIQVFAPDGSFVRKFGENGDGPGTFSRLKGLAFDSFGNLYAVDGGHSNVQIFNAEFQPLMWFGGYAKKIEYFDVPSGIAIDRKRNRIYVCNEFVSRINVYDLVNTSAEDSRPRTADARPAPSVAVPR
jgi:DNA-binding beta-propeller fold protein YncE